MKKVFSKEKYLEWCKKNNAMRWHWYDKCDGLTKKEINELGYLVSESWLVEVEEDE